jgi:hypothetical protein
MLHPLLMRYSRQAIQATHAPLNNMILKLDSNSDLLTGSIKGFCKDCMILWAKVDLAHKDGSKANIGSGIYSHHLIMTNYGHPFVLPPSFITCPNGMPGTMMPPVMSASKDGKPGGMSGMSHGLSEWQASNAPKTPPPFNFASMYAGMLGEYLISLV